MKFLEHVKAAPVWHGDIEQDDVARLVFDEPKGFVPVSSLAGHSHSTTFGDDSFQSFAHNGMVIDNNNFDHLRIRSYSTIRPRELLIKEASNACQGLCRRCVVLILRQSLLVFLF